jgi:hypothetical protein
MGSIHGGAPQRFIAFIVTEAAAGRGDELEEYVAIGT